MGWKRAGDLAKNRQPLFFLVFFMRHPDGKSLHQGSNVNSEKKSCGADFRRKWHIPTE
jgi:hypothetical protein